MIYEFVSLFEVLRGQSITSNSRDLGGFGKIIFGV
jgi:hypothetical protein